MISSLVDKLIETKLDFNKMHITEINTSLSKVLEVGFDYCNDLRTIQQKEFTSHRDLKTTGRASVKIVKNNEFMVGQLNFNFKITFKTANKSCSKAIKSLS